MIFHWYLFLLIIAAGLLAKYAGMTESTLVNGQKVTRYQWIPVLVVIVPMIITAATRTDAFGDTYAYMCGFRDTIPSLSEIPKVLVGDGKDKGFSIFNILIKMLIGNHYQVYFGIVAAICLVCVAIIYRKYSCNFAMSMFLFLASADYLQWTHNGMRQFVAVCIIFAATDLLLKKKYIPYVLVVLFAATMHATALLMLPVCFIVQGKGWNLRSVLFTIAALIAINFSGPLSDFIVDFMTETQYRNEVDQYLATDGTNILRVFVFAIPPVLALLFKRYIEVQKNPILDLSVNMSIVSMGAFIVSAVTSGIFIGRIPIYFSLYNYILLPWIVENVFEKKSAKLVYGALITCYMFFYYYQVVVSWKL